VSAPSEPTPALILPTTLMWPRLRGLRNTWRQAGGRNRAAYAVFGLMGLAFWIGLFWFLHFVIGGFYAVEVFGPLLTRKLLEILLISLFMMLCFSNVVTALSTFYLSADLELLLALPIPRPVLHYSRLGETALQSSWMMAMFGLPVFLAYGMVYQAPWHYYALLAVVMPAFVIIPVALGVVVASMLVNVFPARRTREFMAMAGVLAVVALFVFLRLLRPERFTDARAFDSLAAYVAEIQTPMPTLFPPTWASEVLVGSLQGQAMPWLSLGMLVLGALAVVAAGRWITAKLYIQGWSKSQEARAARGAQAAWMSLLVRWSHRVLPVSWRPIVTKDLRSFFRDPSQWSQVFLLGSLIVVYLFSINAIPMDQFRGPWALALRRALAYLNLGMAGFVMAGVAIRFQFAAVSGEGRAYWVIRSGPVKPLDFLWAKSLLGLVPMLVVGEILAVVSTILLGAGAYLTVMAGGTALFLAVALGGIATAMGAMYPKFDADNASKVATGPAGVLFMVIALTLVGVVLALEAYPVYVWLRSQALEQPVTMGSWAISGALLASAATLCVLAGMLPMRRAARILWSRGLR
jgi:ABC-2 type transport system permease protein